MGTQALWVLLEAALTMAWLLEVNVELQLALPLRALAETAEKRT
jgi:hypothetical protein